MKARRIAFLVLAVAVAVAASGCAAHRMDKVTTTGFLRDYSQLSAGKEGEAAQVYVKPGLSLKGYDQYLLAPVEFWLSPEAEERGLRADVTQDVSERLRKAVEGAFEKEGFRKADKPAAGVLVLRVAMTDLKPAKPVSKTLSILPIGMVLDAGVKAATGEYGTVGQAALEGEFLDGASGERLGAFVDRRAGSKMPFTGKWADVNAAIEHWADVQLRARLQQLKK